MESSDSKETSVELIAAGYEWTCPYCNSLNKEIEITPSVICRYCSREYSVED